MTKMNSHKHNTERDAKENTLNDSTYMKFKARQNESIVIEVMMKASFGRMGGMRVAPRVLKCPSS